MQYAILPTNRDILHRSHKYIERVKTSSGKWRYIYKKSPYKGGSKKSSISSYADYRKAVSNLKKSEANKKQVLKENEINRQNRLNSENNYSEEAKKKQIDVDSYRYKYADASVKKAEMEMRRAWNKFETTPLGKASRAFNIGVQYMSMLLPTTFHNVKTDIKNLTTTKKSPTTTTKKSPTTTLPKNTISSIKPKRKTRR